jgi:hypothetical protein
VLLCLLGLLLPSGVEHLAAFIGLVRLPLNRANNKGKKNIGRRRKIRCSFDPGNSTVCSQCQAHGSACVDQRRVTDSASVGQYGDLRERVSRLETMVDGLADGTLAQPSTGKGLTDLDMVARETVPLMSMFDNAIVCRPDPSKASAVPDVAIGV